MDVSWHGIFVMRRWPFKMECFFYYFCCCYYYTTTQPSTAPLVQNVFSFPFLPLLRIFKWRKYFFRKCVISIIRYVMLVLTLCSKNFRKNIRASSIPAFKKQKRQTFLLLCKHYNFTTSTCSQFTHSSRREKNILYFSKDPFLQGRSFILHILHIAVIIIFLLVQLYLLW